MSNYNSTLQTNNTYLQEVLDKLNRLPDAGSSAGPSSNAVIEYDEETQILTITTTEGA